MGSKNLCPSCEEVAETAGAKLAYGFMPRESETEAGRENTAARLYHLERVSKQWEIEHERLSAENIRLQNEMAGKDEAIGELCMAQIHVATELGVDISGKGPMDGGIELVAAIRAARDLSVLRAIRQQLDNIHRQIAPPPGDARVTE